MAHNTRNNARQHVSYAAGRHTIGDTETSARRDGRRNVWRWMFLLPDDILPRWVLTGTYRKRA